MNEESESPPLPNEEEEKAEGSFADFANAALRLHRRGSFEELLCQHMIMSIAAEPLSKVRLILEAAFMVPPDKLKADISQVENIYTVAVSFLNTDPATGIYISWVFPQTNENFDKYVRPWRLNVPLSFVVNVPADRTDKQKILDAKNGEAEKFYCITTYLGLHPSSFQVLKAQFLVWALPLVMDVYETLSRVIDLDVFEKILGVLKPEGK